MTGWLTRITVATHHRDIRRMLTDGQAQHRYLMRLVDDDLGEHPRRTAGLLYRIENIDATTTMLVQTAQEPRTERLPSSSLMAVQTRQIGPIIGALHPGRLVKYRIVANPTKRWGNSAAPEQQGKLRVLRGDSAQQWWIDRADGHGLDINSTQWRPLPDVTVKRGRHAMAQFDGTATVRDAAAVRDAILTGIGRARSYGCGLLSLALIKGLTDD
ncbi:CRISPR-associated Cse3 family protein [Stackebrandtia endophytica]|uniref:CRISPR-associated Cse3 family protein n=1 Tax=Stackebrandtia endophytica TaxID=1496996 RepID=A0A543AS30_9ACTN|nr:type I-E CRISPR-associated protein Cas6/Cse3/CasE [Stackebrandtia endophytica]TQL75390.1 CRISPR-associated Cse3 family protein [Stackebrandtia endophytica]